MPLPISQIIQTRGEMSSWKASSPATSNPVCLILEKRWFRIVRRSDRATTGFGSRCGRTRNYSRGTTRSNRRLVAFWHQPWVPQRPSAADHSDAASRQNRSPIIAFSLAGAALLPRAMATPPMASTNPITLGLVTWPVAGRWSERCVGKIRTRRRKRRPRTRKPPPASSLRYDCRLNP